MHLEGPWLSTTSTKKRKQKLTKREQDDLERGWRERNQWLKGIHLPKETFEQYLTWVYGKGTKTKTKETDWQKPSPSVSPACKSFPESIVSNNNTAKEDKIKNSVDNPAHGKLWITGAVTTKPTPTYTGSNIIGIATMHKSNMVPIFNDEAAKDVAKMRR